MREPLRGFFGSPSRELDALADAVKFTDGAARRDAGLQSRFRLEIAWGPRADTPRRVAERLVAWARRLREMDSRLDLVFPDRRYVCGSAAEPVMDGAREHSLDRMLGRVWIASRDGITEPARPAAPALGAGFTMHAYLDYSGSAARMTLRAGHHAAPDADNGVLIVFDPSHFLLPDRPLVLEMISSLIEAWQPDIAGLLGENDARDDLDHRWWLAWRRDGFDPHRAPLRRGWPGTLPGAGEPLLGGRLWEWPAHSPTAQLWQGPFG
jgi:hypothetical protein